MDDIPRRIRGDAFPMMCFVADRQAGACPRLPPTGPYSTIFTGGASWSFTKNTRNLAGSVSLAFFETA